MSMHLVQCAAALPLKPVEKLVLLCLAENANSRDSRAFPGLDALMMWSGRSRATVFDALKTLAELGLVKQIGAGYRGRAAEFRVFPHGCCRVHGRAAALSNEPDPSGWAEGSESPDDDQPGNGSGTSDSPPSCGKSGTLDPLGEKGSSSAGERVQPHAQRKGPEDRTPTKNYPQNTSPQGLSPDSTTTAATGEHGDQDVVDLLQRLATA